MKGKIMRYTIGVSMEDKYTGVIEEGFYGIGFLGLTSIIGEDSVKGSLKENRTLYSIYVLDNIEDAEFLCRKLSRSYRRDDVWKNSGRKSRKIRRFYPLKVDSSKFPFLLDEKKHTNRIKKGIYGEDLSPSREFTYQDIVGFKN